MQTASEDSQVLTLRDLSSQPPLHVCLQELRRNFFFGFFLLGSPMADREELDEAELCTPTEIPLSQSPPLLPRDGNSAVVVLWWCLSTHPCS